MSTRKKRPAQNRETENRPIVIWRLPASRKSPSPTGAPSRGVIPLPRPSEVREEAVVTEWVIHTRSGQAPAKITVISSGFGIPAGRNPQSRCMAA
jgi:hypothetical protein